jgi:hypothetical protein
LNHFTVPVVVVMGDPFFDFGYASPCPLRT